MRAQTHKYTQYLNRIGSKMNKVDMMTLADTFDKQCSFQYHRCDPPQARPLKDFGINDEGYCIFCEGHSNYPGLLKTCVSAFVRTRRFQIKEIGTDAIIFEQE